nr:MULTISPECIES: UvrD-helicase domain-containing protein [Myxococcaceae]
MAGAGAGKTYSLVTMALHLLAGARAGHAPLPPARLCLVTFTDKAAAELRSRLRDRLDALARGEAGAAQEPELSASLERLGRAFPSPEQWRPVRAELASAFVGTFHSLCAQLLRRGPAGLGVESGFEVLEALEAQALVRDLCERVVLEALEAPDAEQGAAVRELCQELTFAGTGFSEGLVASLAGVYGKLREEGLRAEQASISSEPSARAAFQQDVEACLRLCAEAREADAAGAWTELCAAAERTLEGMTPENFLAPERFAALEALLRADGRDVSRKSRAPEGRVKELRWRVLGKSDGTALRLVDAYAAWRTVPYEEAFRALLAQVEQRHAAELARRGVLDFTSLLVTARDLLRDRPPFRAQVQERFGALLVDEFQDTNRLQLELVLLLAERREGAPRALSPESALAQALPLEPAFLCAVGDRKQSIYDFRGADVSVFTQLAGKVLSEGGAEHFLRSNRRASPALLAFLNATFAQVMAPRAGAPAYDVAYAPSEDDLSPVRPELAAGPAVERLCAGEGEVSESLRAQDAEAVARRLAALLAPGAEPCVAQGGEAGLRPARGGDVALLFRTFNHLELYRQALVRHGVPHRVLRGRGFYGAQEVLDLAALLALLADPEDALAFATVLRSPLVGLSDASLLRLADADGLRPTSPRLQQLGALGLPAAEQLRLERFLAALPSLRRERDRLAVRALLQAAMRVTGYLEALAASPHAEQASANVHKLLALADRRDAAGAGGCVAFSRELRRLAESDPYEAQADLLDAGDPHAVQLLTIHRAKGLEWPVVVVPGLGGRRRPVQGRALYARGAGLGLRPWLPEGEAPLRSARHEAVRAELAGREAAEAKRLLYVALTRARDRLVLSGAAEHGASRSAWQLLESALAADPGLRALVQDVRVDGLSLPPPPAVAPLDVTAAEAELDAALARVRGPHPAPAGGATACVSAAALQDFAHCARRHALRREGSGLREAGEWWEPGPASVDLEAWVAPRSQGERVRRLLERVDFRLAAASAAAQRAHLEALAAEEGWDTAPGAGQDDAHGVEAVLRLAGGVLASRWARSLGQGALHRRLPYALPLELPEGGRLTLEGQVDLLRELPGGGAELVLYKDSARHPLGAGAYREELAAVRLAARALLPAGVPVRAGVLFLREPSPEPAFPAEGEEAAGLEALARAAQGLLAGAQGPGLQKEGCQALCCGFTEVCFPGPGA